MSAITINGITIDPAAPKTAALAARPLEHATAKDSDYILVQTKGPLTKEQRAALAKAGAKILEAVPGSAFVCHFPATSLAKVRALPFVVWADIYPGAVKLSPQLLKLEPQPGGVALAAAAIAAPGRLDATKVTIYAVLHRTADVRRAAKHIAEAAHLTPADVTIAGRKAKLTLKTRRLADVAALDEVRHIERVFPRKLANNIARQILRAPNAGSTTTASAKGEIVAIADTGFDKGSTTDVHPAFKGRVKKLYALGRPGRKDDPDGHGTHVAGSVLGDGVSKSDGPIRGTAPGAKLVLQSVLDSSDGLGGLPDDLHDLFGPPYTTDKARVHSNSWGSVSNFGVYDQQAQDLDDFVSTHRDMLICFAAATTGRTATRTARSISIR